MTACWGRGLGGCGGGPSREHIFSGSQFPGTKMVLVSGMPWLPEPKPIGLASMVAKNLCRDHNSELSPTDAEAAKLRSALEEAKQRIVAKGSVSRRRFRSKPFDVDVDLLERWILKCSFNVAMQFTDTPTTLFIDGEPNLSLVRVAFGYERFEAPYGLYWYIDEIGEVKGADAGTIGWVTNHLPTGELGVVRLNFHGFQAWLTFPGFPIAPPLARMEEMRIAGTGDRIRFRRRHA